MASGDWQILLETGVQRDLAKLRKPSPVREARGVIDGLQFDPVPPSAVKLRHSAVAQPRRPRLFCLCQTL